MYKYSNILHYLYHYYYSNQQCEWRIEAANITDAIRMEITDAEIEYHASCVYDHGEVFDGNFFLKNLSHKLALM
jgi:hypothetical protein